MTNRLPLALGVCAGYVLGRTRKAKLALTLAGAAAGRKLPLGPQAAGSRLTARLTDNPQVKQVRDQLRKDLGGVGKAATGALLERRVGGLADRLEERARGLQDRVTGGRDERDDDAGGADAYDARDEQDEDGERPERSVDDTEGRGTAPSKKKAAGKQAPRRKAAPAAKPAKKAASGARRTASSAGKKAGSATSAGTRGGGRRD